MAVTTEKVQVDVEINGMKAGSTIKEMETTVKQLRRELKELPTDADAFAVKAAELKKVNAQLQNINNSVKDVDKSLEGASKQSGMFSGAISGAMSIFMGGGLLGLVQGAISGITELFTSSVEGAQEAARATDQLTQALHGNSEAAQELGDQAGELEIQMKGLFEAEDIQDAQTRLSLYTQEAGQIKELTPLITDLAVAKGIDLVSAADAVGKSLSGNGDALKKLGISVKDAASEEDRFKIITDGLTDTVKGQAQAVADSTKTGWDGLKVTFNNLKEDLGGKLIPIINSFGNFLAELWNKAQPVLDVFKTIWDVFGQVWDSVKQLISSFGIFSDKASVAETIMKGLAAMLTPLKLAFQGVGFVIKGVSVVLNEMVARGNASVSAMVAIFSNFKTFFTNLFSNIGDVIKGVFSLDAEKIKQGIAGMKEGFTSMGGEIATAYSKGYNEVIDRQKASLEEKEETEHKRNIEKKKTQVKELSEAELKALADAAKKAKEKADAQKAKDEAAEIKRKADLVTKLADLEGQVQDMRVAAMKEGEEKAIAQEALRYQREQAAQVNRMNELRKLGAKEAEIKALADQFEIDSKTQHEDNLTDIHIKALADQKAADEKTADERQKIQDEKYKKELEATDQFYDTLSLSIKEQLNEKVAAENLNSDQIKAAKSDANNALLQLEILKNEELLKVQQDYGQSTLATENELANQRMELAERTQAFKKEQEAAVMDTMAQGLDFAIEVLGRDEEARKKNADLLKAFNIAKITMDLIREVQGIWAGVAELGPILGPILGGIQTGFAVGRGMLAVSKLKSQKYARGGYTGDGVDIFDSTGEAVAGVVHAKEWVAPRWMVSNPRYHNVINHLEGVRQRGFASGGFTTTPVNNISTSLDLMGTENKLDQLINAFKEFPTRLKADVVYTEFEAVENSVQSVRHSAQVGTG